MVYVYRRRNIRTLTHKKPVISRITIQKRQSKLHHKGRREEHNSLLSEKEFPSLSKQATFWFSWKHEGCHLGELLPHPVSGKIQRQIAKYAYSLKCVAPCVCQLGPLLERQMTMYLLLYSIY